MSTVTAPTEPAPLDDASFAAIRAVITSVAPYRLLELERERDLAFTQALGTDSLVPVHTFLTRWRAVAAVERDLATAARLHLAEVAARSGQDPDERRESALEIAAVLLTVAAELTAPQRASSAARSPSAVGSVTTAPSRSASGR
ncbi:DUF6247 family protein [Kitasatospora sp. NPDC051853]|uniref:DUF6247 family protein n=1 Tax=Kitasatospora sp. NPDC051853 TaxID=3364058 RepID=UPI0037B02702